MPTLIHRRVAACAAGENPTTICRMESGWAVLCDTQFLRGYSLLLPDPVFADINDLNKEQRMQFLYDMTIIGDAIREVTGSYRINYQILGNLDPALHAHITPRYLSEPEERRKAPHYLYDKDYRDSIPFDYERDQDLIRQLAAAIQHRSAA